MFGRSRSDGSRSALAGAAAAAASAPAQTEAADGQDQLAAAFFDCDNTLIAGASTYYFARGLAARDFFTTRDLLAFGWHQLKFRVGGKENHAGMVEAREAALAFVAGRRVSEIEAYGEEIYDELIAARVIAGTRALAQQHLDAGQRVWLVTAAPAELAQIIARRLGLTGALGTVAESIDGVYTGHLLGEPLHGQAKAEAVRAVAQREELDLGRCAAYSDSVNDLPMLSIVGHPMAINPDPDLKRAAAEQGWPTRDFRSGRKAARIGVPAAGGAGMLAGAIVAGAAVRRRSHR